LLARESRLHLVERISDQGLGKNISKHLVSWHVMQQQISRLILICLVLATAWRFRSSKHGLVVLGNPHGPQWESLTSAVDAAK
jgi:hypothetical protein